MRRRNKSLVTAGYLDKRISYCESVKRKADEMLLKWAYTDGTVYYLDRSQEEAEDSKGRSLGTHVWRRSDNRDAMYQECIGPSAYSKGQGTPCKVWGFLACGVLHIHVLEEGESMDADLYTELVDEKFDECESMPNAGPVRASRLSSQRMSVTTTHCHVGARRSRCHNWPVTQQMQQ